VMPDFIICLEDGKKFKSLKRHLRTQYDLSPDSTGKMGSAGQLPVVRQLFGDLCGWPRTSAARRLRAASRKGSADTCPWSGRSAPWRFVRRKRSPQSRGQPSKDPSHRHVHYVMEWCRVINRAPSERADRRRNRTAPCR
jgi:hypothetical protein